MTLWDETNQEAQPYLTDYLYARIGKNTSVLLRKDSDYILWDKVMIQ